jgi:hypothetical protein
VANFGATLFYEDLTDFRVPILGRGRERGLIQPFGKGVIRARPQAAGTMKYNPVKFRMDRNGNDIAFEDCGCEADAKTFRPCRKHCGNEQQAVRLEAEARYHSIQKRPQKAGSSSSRYEAGLTS